MACNMFETQGQFWDVANLQAFAVTPTGRRPRNYHFTKLGWFAQLYGNQILVEGCTTEEEAFTRGKAILEARHAQEVAARS